MVDELTLKEVLEKKSELEKVLLKTLTDFEDVTKLSVEGIRLRKVEMWGGSAILCIEVEVHL